MANIKVDNTPLNRSPQLGTSFAPIVKKVMPSVVNIYSTQIIHMRPMHNPLLNDPFFRQFFGDQFPNDNTERTRREQSLGSGVIISPDGYILTANHVVDGADEIKVSIGQEKKEYTARVIGKDAATDIAVLKIDAHNLPAITLGDSDQLEIGDVVLAIGNPFGVGQTVTKGIVSALGRSGFDFNGGNYSIQNFIQTDAAINPGNSGGALVDAEGRLVGINTAIITSSHGSEGIGFAVPVDLARNTMERLISGGKISRGYLGITMQDITSDLAQQFDLSGQNGVLVDDVLPDTPAAKAGINSGDVIIAFDGKPVADGHALQLAVSEATPGSSVDVKLIRDGRDKTVNVKLAELPNSISGNDNSQNNSTASNKTDALDGVTVADLDQDIRDQLKVPDNIQGTIVTDVDQDSNSAEAGLLRNDIIVEINHHPVTNSDDAVRLCKEAKGSHILVKVWRRVGEFVTTRFITVDNTRHAD